MSRSDDAPPLFTRAGALRLFAGLLTVGSPLSGHAATDDADTSDYMAGEGFPYDSFDRLPVTDVHIGGSTIHVGFVPGRLGLPKSAIIERVRQAGFAVAHYYGHFPVPSVRFMIVPVPGEGVEGGTTWGYRGAAIRIIYGQDTDQDELHDDWVMTHEMVHTALPDMSRRYSWLSEGLAVYIEPIARVQVGDLTAKRIWSDMKRDMPKGLPRAGDEGLDYTATWGRIYWGGALFCLLCDIGIRQRSGNKLGLQDAMRGVLAAGGNHEVEWPITKILATADKAVGFTVMNDLYKEMHAKPVRPDMTKLWADLGVVGEPGEITFDDNAPLASVRLALTHRPTT